jgi:hypothetical protein
MLVGVGVFGVLAASLASLFIERDREQEADPKLADIADRLERIERMLDGHRPAAPPDGSGAADTAPGEDP